MRWLIAIIPVLIAVLAACDADETREVARGFAVDGLCDIRREPAVVGPDRNDNRWLEDYELSGKAHQDRIELTWDPQEIPGLTGYRVARYSYDYQNRLDGDSIRTFEVNGASTDFIDTDGLKPDREYHYRVFPVTTDGIDLPSRRLVIWTMPAELPPPPNRVSIGTWGHLTTEYSVLAPVTGIRVLTRDDNSGRWHHVADKEYTRRRDYWGYSSWPEDGRFDKAPFYAVCLSNGYGYGKALSLDTRLGESVDPPPTPHPIRNVVANPTGDVVELSWSPLADSSVVGILVYNAIWTHEFTIWAREIVLPPNAKSHLAYGNVYRIQTINNYGIADETNGFEVLSSFEDRPVARRESYAWEPWSTKEERGTLMVGMRSDSPVKFEVVRKELTEGGFREKPIPTACVWQYRRLDRYCEIEDLDVVRGGWYVYEIRWQDDDGSWNTDFHEVLPLDPR